MTVKSSMLGSLPVVASHDLGLHKGLYTVGSKVLVAWQAYMPRVPLVAYLVTFKHMNPGMQECVDTCCNKRVLQQGTLDGKANCTRS